MKDQIDSQVCKEGKRNGRTKMNINRREIIMRDPNIISADDDTEFALMVMYRTITDGMNSKRKCMKREFNVMLG